MVSSNYSNSKNNSIIIYNNIGVISLYSKLNMLTFQVYDKAYYKVCPHTLHTAKYTTLFSINVRLTY